MNVSANSVSNIITFLKNIKDEKNAMNFVNNEYKYGYDKLY